MATYYNKMLGRSINLGFKDDPRVRNLQSQFNGANMRNAGMVGAGADSVNRRNRNSYLTGLNMIRNNQTGFVGPQAGQMAGAAGGGGGGPYQRAFDEATAANKARENEITTGLTDLRGRTMDRSAAFANQQRADQSAAYDAQRAGVTQQMVNAGLSSSTVLPTMQAGVTRQQQADSRRLEDGILQREQDYDRQSAMDLLGFRERITDAYPDYNQMAQLAQGVGAASGAMGGGGGGFGSGGYSVPGRAYGGPIQQQPMQAAGGAMQAPAAAQQPNYWALKRLEDQKRMAQKKAAAKRPPTLEELFGPQSTTVQPMRFS